MSVSFSAQTKLELDALPIKNPCCRKAFLYGLLYRAESVGGDRITVTFPVCGEELTSRETLVASAIRNQLGRTPEILRETRGAHRYLHVSFSSHTASVLLRRLSDIPAPCAGHTDVAETAEGSAAAVIGFHCADCAAHFLRGVFISSGSVNDPKKSVHVEFRVPADGRADRLAAVLESVGFVPGRTEREGTVGLYFKSNQTVSDLLPAIGAVGAYFRLSDVLIAGEIRGHENRVTNIETLNISRSVGAIGKHLAAIRGLEEMGLLDNLPPDLRTTVALRRDNPEASLSELAELHDPPITKSGLNHRLEKIMQIYERAVKDQEHT